MRLDVSMEETFPVPVTRVWHALTDSRMISRWLMATDDFRAEVGARFTLHDETQDGCRGHVECQVLELSPPDRIVWSWSNADDPGPTRLVIELEAHGEGTRLTLRHTGEADERTVTGTTAGWVVKLRQLSEALLAPPASIADGRVTDVDRE
jgi:uncharacterized protein YndB with AHSA1/START domain